MFALLWLGIALFRTPVGAQQPSSVAATPVLPLYLPFASSGRIDGSPHASLGQDLLSFHHPPFGLTLAYPADWRLETLDSVKLPPTPEYLPPGYSAQEDTEGYQTIRNRITLYPPSFAKNPNDAVSIFINFYRISPSGDLSTVVALQNQLDHAGFPPDATKITVAQQTIAGVDDSVVVSYKDQLAQSETIWLAKDGLIYGVSTFSANSTIIAMLHKIVATIQFDGTTKALYEKYQKYLANADADALRKSIEATKPKPPLDCDIVCRDEKERRRP